MGGVGLGREGPRELRSGGRRDDGGMGVSREFDGVHVSVFTWYVYMYYVCERGIV